MKVTINSQDDSETWEFSIKLPDDSFNLYNESPKSSITLLYYSKDGELQWFLGGWNCQINRSDVIIPNFVMNQVKDIAIESIMNIKSIS